MITKSVLCQAQRQAKEIINRAGIVLTPEEEKHIEVADFGLSRLAEVGLELVIYVNTDRVCAKELALTPWQICPEHKHPPVAGEPGKEETFRCRWGTVYLYVPGEAVADPKAQMSEDVSKYMTVWHEIVLKPGEQYTLHPNTLHWFQGGPDGAVVSEFSTKSRDESDIFTDPRIERSTKVVEG